MKRLIRTIFLLSGWVLFLVVMVMNYVSHKIIPPSLRYETHILDLTKNRNEAYDNEQQQLNFSTYDQFDTETVKFLSRDQNGWRRYRGECRVQQGFKLARLSDPVNTPIYVYNADYDIYVSKSIIQKGMWERPLVEMLYGYLLKDPQIVFLDIGANVGIFSLMAAKLGNTVFSIDCLRSNVDRLCASVSKGNFSSRVNIIYNALSNEHTNVTLGRYSGNVGGTYVKSSNADTKAETIATILLDDILDIYNFTNTRVIIKMDVETFEAKVLQSATKFFATCRVEYLLMEYHTHIGKSSGDFIIDFLLQREMKLIMPAFGTMLPEQIRKKLPGTLLWERIKTK